MPEEPESPLTAPITPGVAIPTLGEIFWGFFKVTVSGFGGVLAWARREFVQNRRWFTPDEFNNLFALCQFLPGPNIVNFGIIYGWRLYGPLGAASALTGLLGPPVVLMIVAGTLYKEYGTLPVFSGGLNGLAAAAAGLMISNAVQMFEPLVRRDRLIKALLALVAFLAVGVMQWSLVWVLLVMAPVSIAIAWRSPE